MKCSAKYSDIHIILILVQPSLEPLTKLDFSFVSNGVENDRTDHFLFIMNQTIFHLAHHQKKIVQYDHIPFIFERIPKYSSLSVHILYRTTSFRKYLNTRLCKSPLSYVNIIIPLGIQIFQN